MRFILLIAYICTLVQAVLQGSAASGVQYDAHSLLINGKRTFLWGGEFHPFRLPSPSLWKDILEKMVAGGKNAVSIYLHWGFHSPAPGVLDFTGIRDLDRFLTVAKQVGIYVIARPGPYIHAETTGGGLPAWLGTRLTGRERSTDPDYTRYWQQFFNQAIPIIARHQIAQGGSVILVQVENEYPGLVDSAAAGQHMAGLEAYLKTQIQVPLMINDLANQNRWATGVGSVDMYGWDGYPQGFDCSNPQTWTDYYSNTPSHYTRRQPNSPLFIPEFQGTPRESERQLTQLGGAFDPWGGPGYAKCHELTSPLFDRTSFRDHLVNNVTLISFYMNYGGTNWGHSAGVMVYTSYDYGASIDESRQLTDKYYEDKMMGYFVAASPDLTVTWPLAIAAPSDIAIKATAVVNPTTGSQYWVLRPYAVTTLNTHKFTLANVAGYSIPQLANTYITLNGRDSKLLVANYGFGGNKLVYATAEVLTYTTVQGRDTIILYGAVGDDAEILLAASSKVTAKALDNSVFTATPGQGTLRLNFKIPDGISHLYVANAGAAPLLILIVSRGVAFRMWRFDTTAGPVIAYGPYLVRSAVVQNNILQIRADISTDAYLEIWGPATTSFTVNGKPQTLVGTNWFSTYSKDASLLPAGVSLPPLTNWKYSNAGPEIQPGFDDSTWIVCDNVTTNNRVAQPAGEKVLYADDYGFHMGNVIYRGVFTATGSETAISVVSQDGAPVLASAYALWINGVYLGWTRNPAVPKNVQTTYIPPAVQLQIAAGTLKAGQSNVITVVFDYFGADPSLYGTYDRWKSFRGLRNTFFTGSSAPIVWKIQGNQGGENPPDFQARGTFNVGGLYGERNGWHLPAFPDQAWKAVALPYNFKAPGLAWFRTTFTLNIAATLDVPIGIQFSKIVADGPKMRAMLFINGFQFGRYLKYAGPQTLFPIPPGILNTQGLNTIAISVWGLDTTGTYLDQVTLTQIGAYTYGGDPVALVPAPAYQIV